MLAILPAAAWADKVVYVQGDRAPLYAAPQLGKTPVAVAVRGTPLTVVDGNSRWYQVRGEGLEGWVVKFMVSDQPPVTTQTGSDTAMEALMKRARVRPSAYSTTAAARGLRAKGDGLQDAHQVDYQGVAEMEGFQPTAEAVADFFQADPEHE
jgi:hypothetical protein